MTLFLINISHLILPKISTKLLFLSCYYNFPTVAFEIMPVFLMIAKIRSHSPTRPLQALFSWWLCFSQVGILVTPYLVLCLQWFCQVITFSIISICSTPAYVWHFPCDLRPSQANNHPLHKRMLFRFIPFLFYKDCMMT